MARSSAQTSEVKITKQGVGNNSLPDKATMLELYRKMLLIRRFEEKAGQLYGMGLIGGFCHLYIGQEAVVTGMETCITRKDAVITTYRDHGHMLACDMDPKGVMAELTGRAGGYSKGKGGSMHMFSVENNFWGGHGIVGASVPLGAGLAFARKYRGTNDICVCYYGDGAANQGQVYETYNMAALWGLPILFIIENNEYAMGTSVQRSHAATELFRAGESLGVKGEQVNGMDVVEVMEKGKKAVERVRKGEPYILEMKTYRYRGHSMSDPAKYRTKEEVDNFKETRDPIDSLRNRGLAAGIIKEEDLKKIDAEIKEIIRETEEFAKASPEPEVSELWTDITQ